MYEQIDNGDLIHFLYRAVDEPNALEEFASRFATSYNSDFGFISERQNSDYQVLDMYEWGFGKAGIKAYIDYFYQFDVWTNGLRGLPQSKFHASHEIYPDDEMLKTKVYNDYALGLGIRHGVGAFFAVPYTSRYIHFAGARRADQGRYSPATTVQLNQLIPHLQQFMHLRTRFGDLQGRVACMEQALTRMGTAVFVCNQDGKILYHTAQAEELLRTCSELFAPNRILSTKQKQANTKLKALIQNAAAASRGEVCSPGGALRVDEADGVLEMIVTPIRYAPPGGMLGASSPCAAVFVREGGAPRMIAPEILSALYNLSMAESDIAIRMSQGVSIAHIAELRGVSVQTVRKQTKILYQKTGTAGQSDLVALVGASLASMAESPSFTQDDASG